MLRTIVAIFILGFLFLVGACIWDSISDSMRKAERANEEKQKAEEARKRYPPIKDWETHPLYKVAIQFLLEKIDFFIGYAKKIEARRDAIFSIGIEVKPDGVYLFSDIQNYIFYYSNVGYDNIKVGYYKEESEQACRDFARALTEYLKRYYKDENIIISDVNYFVDPEGYFPSSIKFWIDLSNLMNRLKQV